MSQPVLDTEGLRRIFVAVSDLSDSTTSWNTDGQNFTGDRDRARISLDLFSLQALAVDEHRRAYNLPGQPANSFTTTEIGNRTLVITVRAESYDGGAQAAELLDRIRTGIRAEVVRDALNEIGLAYVWSEQATRVQYVIDNRIVNCAVADFTFGGVAKQVSSVVVDGSGSVGGYISTVNTNNTVPGTLTP